LIRTKEARRPKRTLWSTRRAAHRGAGLRSSQPALKRSCLGALPSFVRVHIGKIGRPCRAGLPVR